MRLTPDDEVHTREELVAFVRSLHQDCLARGHEWENQTLDRFLEALAAWMEDSPGCLRSQRMPQGGDWTYLAKALQAATLYE
ncbi:DUF7660 family protein [Streptomyces lavendofoliae]|uniref:DUF7660 family protein n=1 Tax=Streptomyces lavendofoliae TaxID=67314 RepID=UPI003D8DADA2